MTVCWLLSYAFFQSALYCSRVLIRSVAMAREAVAFDSSDLSVTEAVAHCAIAESVPFDLPRLYAPVAIVIAVPIAAKPVVTIAVVENFPLEGVLVDISCS